MSKYKVGNKVILREDLLLGEVYGNQYWTLYKDKELRSLPYIEITRKLANGDYIVDNGWTISDLEIAGLHEEPVEDETKYLWASDEYEHDGDEYVRFITTKQKSYIYGVGSIMHKEILKGVVDKFLMTESEAKEHHLFKAMNRIEVQKEDVQKEELYFIRPFDCEQQHLIELGGGYLFVGDNDLWVNSEARKHFTKEECDEIIGTSTILYKVLVE